MVSHMVALWEKLLFWKQPKIKEGKTYRFITVDELDVVELLDKFPGVKYTYDGAKFEEQGEAGILKIDYTIVDSGEYNREALQKSDEFVTILGDILLHIIESDIKDESSRKDNPKKSDLQ